MTKTQSMLRNRTLKKLETEISKTINIILKDVKMSRLDDLVLDKIDITVDNDNTKYFFHSIKFNWLL